MQFNPHNLKGVFLDLDDTLYPYPHCNEAGIQAAVSYLAKELNKPSEQIRQAFLDGRAATKQLLKTAAGELAASHHRLLYLQKAIEEILGRTNPELTLIAEQVFWDAYLAGLALFPGAREFLERAKAQGKIIAIVTDMTAQMQLKKVVRLGIDHLIDFIITSEEAGRDKPDPAILHLALKKTHFSTDEVVMVGEDEAHDIAAARAAGITAIAIHKKPTDASVLFAKDFQELIKILNV
ncbi:HAD family hydrolase [Candidatus Uhrbacteria bacterium]|nr:HAD family hydrolase [Candidatus Uhrbacteria bacterium]